MILLILYRVELSNFPGNVINKMATSEHVLKEEDLEEVVLNLLKMELNQIDGILLT